MQHSPAQLALANACHPGMDPTERLRRLRRVADAEGDVAWQVRLRACSPLDDDVQAWAMRMLDDYEGHRRPRDDDDNSGLATTAVVVVLALLLVVVMLWRRRASS